VIPGAAGVGGFGSRGIPGLADYKFPFYYTSQKKIGESLGAWTFHSRPKIIMKISNKR
jgi:hypothetical protein